MKLLFDEDLPPRLVELLAGVYPGSLHVHQCGLGASDDSAIWEYAKKNGLTIVSKDSDFQERSSLLSGMGFALFAGRLARADDANEFLAMF